MSTYGASFVRKIPDRATSFRELSRFLRETNANWLAASPTNFVLELVLRASEESEWISIQKPLAGQLLQTISRSLGTTAIAIYMIDEMILRFSYRRFCSGEAVRVLEYADNGNLKNRGKWTLVKGDAEPWEALLFSHRLMELYRRYAPDEASEGCTQAVIKQGFSIPWPCDALTITEIVRTLQLPWEPVGNRFPHATEIDIIPGSPERWGTLRRFFHRWKR